MTHNIRLLQPHIMRAKPRIAAECSLALALTQHFGKTCYVGSTFFYLGDEEYIELPKINLPTIAIKFLHDFDRGFKTLQPFTFPVTLPTGLENLLTCHYCKHENQSHILQP